ncbi:hypothetical protein NP233_g8377 [Leucocoprinus birnbaumii]|uniref:Uncharacterized protein n=1 Tax=Leucocoprinus birnbaumii TaxID=56174 RepID=A0AAD5VME3_9AGAR|nr:hypothetical protein NP233_g8377 [Leucocoprinus birnbaumii]
MKFIAALLACVTAAAAQSIRIAAPVAGTHLSPGQSTVVEVTTPDFLSSSVEVAVAIGISPCSSGSCRSPSSTLGNLLYSGPYQPQLEGATRVQNFTVTVPSFIPQGQAIIGVAHFALIGASLQPWLETQNVSVVIQ